MKDGTFAGAFCISRWECGWQAERVGGDDLCKATNRERAGEGVAISGGVKVSRRGVLLFARAVCSGLLYLLLSRRLVFLSAALRDSRALPNDHWRTSAAPPVALTRFFRRRSPLIAPLALLLSGCPVR